jgi:hypothetical protein
VGVSFVRPWEQAKKRSRIDAGTYRTNNPAAHLICIRDHRMRIAVKREIFVEGSCENGTATYDQPGMGAVPQDP